MVFFLTNYIDNSNHISCSAFEVEKLPQKQEQQQSQSQHLHFSTTIPARRAVHFEEDCNKYYNDTWRSSSGCSIRTTWYDRNDYRNFKENDRYLIKKIKKEQRVTNMKESNFAFSYHLRMLYMAVRTASHAGIEDIDSALTSKEQKKMFQLYAAAADSDDESHLDMIGLEHKLAAVMKRDSRYYRSSRQEAVADIQADYRDGAWPEASDHEVQEAMRESILAYSNTLVLFAQLLAKAQQNAR